MDEEVVFDWAHCRVVDLTEVDAGLRSDDPKVRARAVSAICPCRMDRSVFEHYLGMIRRMQKDPDASVRAAVRHVLQESMELQGAGQPTHPSIMTNEMAATKFRNRWREEADEDVTPRHHRRR